MKFAELFKANIAAVIVGALGIVTWYVSSEVDDANNKNFQDVTNEKIQTIENRVDKKSKIINDLRLEIIKLRIENAKNHK